MSDDHLQRFVERLVDGEALDWNEAARQLSPGRVNALRRIDSIARAYRRAVPATGTDRFRHLLLVERIGGGFGGEVWRARDTLLDRDVALKLHAGALTDAERQARLLDEARALARIDHPNVLRVLGAEVVDGRVGVWSEFVDGENLEARLARDGCCAAGEACGIGIDLCGALAAVHRAGFVHGDVKPANVLRTRGGRYVLCDLGSAVALRDRVGTRALASGSPLYLAPEVLDGTAPSVGSDLYALGATLFHLLAGTPPVIAGDLDALRAAHRAGRRENLRELRPDLPPHVVAAIERAVATEPASRHPSAAAFATALTARARTDRRLFAAMAAILAAAIGAIAYHGARMTPAASLADDVRWHRGDGTPLLDGDRVREGDTLWLELSCTRTCWTYVLSEDDSHEVVNLYPPKPPAQPQPAHATLRLPGVVDGAERHWRIGPARGAREHLLLVVAPASLTDLEAPPPAMGDTGERFRGIDTTVAAPAPPATGLAAIEARLQADPASAVRTSWLRLQRADAVESGTADTPRR